jgi:tetratricopeptide (TPR) repeat protein
VKALDEALAAAADFADALALRAACQEPPVAGGALHLPFAGHSARKDIERALALAPHNPRVLLIDAVGDYLLPGSQGGNRERALSKLRQTVAAFEAERAGPEPVPGWGAAEAYLYLARDLMDHGDAVGARDALERALLLAPDYRQARRLMAKIAAG